MIIGNGISMNFFIDTDTEIAEIFVGTVTSGKDDLA